MSEIIKKIQNVIRNRTTYRVGLLQAKAYRLLKVYTQEGLSNKGISTIDWAFLGLLRDSLEGMKSNEIALELGVEPPFVTVLFQKMKKHEFVDSKKDIKDSRSKIISLSEKGKKFVSETESELRSHMKILLKDISKSDIISYVHVLEKITKNFTQLKN